MKNKTNKIFQEGNCLNEEELLRYVNGISSEEERFNIESHLVSCELCNDALEGLQAFSSTENFEISHSEINRHIENLTQETKTKVLFPWKIAAAFILLFASASLLWFFVPKNNPSNTLTLETEKLNDSKSNEISQFESNEQLLNNDNEINKETTDKVSKNEKSENKVIPSQKETTITTREISEADNLSQPSAVSGTNLDEITLEDNQTNSKVESEKTDNKKSLSKDNSFEQPAYEQLEVAVNRKTTTATGKSISLEESKFDANLNNINSDYQQGLKAFNDHNYKLAIKKLENIKTPTDALYFSGLSYFNIENYKNSIIKLNEYVGSSSIQFAEKAWWHLAKSYFILDKIEESKKCIEKTISFEGEYKKEAIELLNQLNEKK